MQTVTLNNGVQMPILGLGVLRTNAEETTNAVKTALENGYRLIDTAAGYMNEKAVGAGIKASGVPREEIFLTTKLFVSDTGYERTMAAFERTLRLLDTDYLDLWLIHEPYGDIFGSWRAMTELYHQGKIRAIGVANFHNDRLLDLIMNGTDVVPAVNQYEAHPFYQNEDILQFDREQGVQFEAWSPLASGMKNIFGNSVLQTIADAHQATISQVVLRWLTQREMVVIPKTTHLARMQENLASLTFNLTSDEMKQIQTLDENQTIYTNHRDPAYVKALSGSALTFEE
ncbi:MAG TPA: aldo/keto reductase [Lactobacillaceae bacterium]|jgi:diketogulonate reductase-like aldo/keto reductase